MLWADNISIQFGDERVLDRFSCHVERGAFACVVGASGCGKTSLLKAFLGFTPLREGVIRVGEHVLSESTCSHIRKRISYLPQELSLPYDTVNEAVAHMLRIGNVRYEHKARLSLVQNLMKLGLDEDLLGKRLIEISGGQRQRLMLAALALLGREVWLLDEPTAALDRDSRNHVVDFLIEQQGRGTTVVAVSHDMWFASQSSVIIRLG